MYPISTYARVFIGPRNLEAKQVDRAFKVAKAEIAKHTHIIKMWREENSLKFISSKFALMAPGRPINSTTKLIDQGEIEVVTETEISFIIGRLYMKAKVLQICGIWLAPAIVFFILGGVQWVSLCLLTMCIIANITYYIIGILWLRKIMKKMRDVL